jgi:hypothetical protein
MRNIGLVCALLLACSQPAWGIYGPSLTRADAATALRACKESEFAQSQNVMQAMKSGNPDEVLRVLGSALREWRNTPVTSEIYVARAFCLHELVPNQLPREGEISSAHTSQPTATVARYLDLGIRYFYYEPDAEWILDKDPVDLKELATKRLDSRWGREAFLMMTQIGWSAGGCSEGPDQFREVIKRGESFLARYPRSEVSDSIGLELANAYATWWNLSRTETDPSFTPEPYKTGADAAKEKAIELYRKYLDRKQVPPVEVQGRLKALQQNPKGSQKYDYFCADYED